jgi:hypothetical protein
MTASAIRGDREKCLEAGMNNYLAKPVRADTLKQMLESYLHQESAPIATLQAEADDLVDSVVASNATDQTPPSTSSTPTPPRAKPPASSSSSPLRRPKPLPHQQQNHTLSPTTPTATTATEIHLTPAELARKPQAQAQMRAQMKAVEQQIRDSQNLDNHLHNDPEIVAEALRATAREPALVSLDGDDGEVEDGEGDPGRNVKEVDPTTLGKSLPPSSSSSSSSKVDGGSGSGGAGVVNGTADANPHPTNPKPNGNGSPPHERKKKSPR